jgi:hypothetical protein
MITISMQWSYGGRTGGAEVFQSAASDFINRLRDKTPLWRAISRNVLWPAKHEQFASEGAETGGWEQLAESTVKKRGSAHPILHDSGLLEGSFDEGGEGHIEEFLPESGEWGTSLARGYAHQVGAYNHWTGKNLPKREIFYWNERLQALTEAEFIRWAAEMADGIFMHGPGWTSYPSSGA